MPNKCWWWIWIQINIYVWIIDADKVPFWSVRGNMLTHQCVCTESATILVSCASSGIGEWNTKNGTVNVSVKTARRDFLLIVIQMVIFCDHDVVISNREAKYFRERKNQWRLFILIYGPINNSKTKNVFNAWLWKVLDLAFWLFGSPNVDHKRLK